MTKKKNTRKVIPGLNGKNGNGLQQATLRDLKQHGLNPRKHTPRNVAMIENSLREVGAARSGVIDENGVILAGNGTYEALSAAGIEKVKIVETDGNEWVVVKRTGLTEEQKRHLVVADNRTSELAQWDPEMLKQHGDLSQFFMPFELIRIGVVESDPNDPSAHWPSQSVASSLH